MSRQSRRSLHAVLLAAIAGVPSLAYAQVSGSWINPGGGTWTVGANWDSDPLYPSAGGTANFTPITGAAATVTLNSGLALSSIRFDNSSAFVIGGAGSITLVGPSVINADQTEAPPGVLMHSINVPLLGTGGLVKQGSGAVLLGSASYTGSTTITGGTLSVNSGTFGAASSTITLDGGTLTFSIGSLPHTIASPVVIGPAGGALWERTSSVNVVLAAPISGSGTLTIGSFLSSQGLFFAQASSDFSGVLQINNPLILEKAGSLRAAQIHNHSALTITNDSTTGVLDRLSDNAPFELGATLQTFSTPDATPAIETVGPMTLVAAAKISATATAQLATSQLIRSDHWIIYSYGSDAASSGPYVRITGTLPTLAGNGPEGTPQVGVLPWAQTWDAVPVTLDATGHLRSLTPSEYVTTLPSGTSTSNVRLASGGAANSPVTVNSLALLDGTLSGPGTIGITGGQLILGDMLPSRHAIITAPIDFGSAEGIILGSGGTISGAISGTGGVTIGSYVHLTGTSSYTGPTNVRADVYLYADVLPGVPGPLGADTSAVDALGLHFDSTVQGTIQFGRDLSLRDGGISVDAATARAIFSGRVNLSGNCRVAPRGTVEFDGPLSGDGAINGANIIFNANNHEFIGTIIGGGFVAGADDALGRGTLILTDSLTASGTARTLSNALVIRDSTSVSTPPSSIGGTVPLTLTGAVDLATKLETLSVTNTATTTFTNTVSNGRFVKTGSGLLEVGGVQLRALTVAQGPVRVLPGGSVPSKTNSLSITAGASLDLTNNAIVIDYTGTSPQSGIRAMLTDGRLNSSFADATHALGYGESGDLGISSFEGVAVDPTSVLVDFTYRGDANLDEKVDIVDLYALASHWNTSTAGWAMGDFNDDGLVNKADLTCLAINWQAGVAAPSTTPLSETLAALGLPAVEIPEPAGIGFAILCLGMGASRRARRTQT